MGNWRTITAVKPQRRAVKVFLDGELGLTLSPKVAAEVGLSVGQTFSEEELRELEFKELSHRALEKALHLLSYRPRSEGEVKSRLRRQGFGEEVIAHVIERLQELGLLDDLAFALAFKESRETFRPRSKRLLERELRRKGVAPEVIAEAVADVDDESEAYRAGLKKSRQLVGKDFPEFRRKLTTYLSRRGFDWEVIKAVTERLWQEIGGESS